MCTYAENHRAETVRKFWGNSLYDSFLRKQSLSTETQLTQPKMRCAREGGWEAQ